MKSLKYVETLKEAEILLQGGHVIVGNKVARDPDLIVPRGMEDYITWDEKSKIKRKLDDFKGTTDDYLY